MQEVIDIRVMTLIYGHKMETRKRSFLKAIIWNLMGLAVMVLVSFVATGSFTTSGKIALANTFIGLCTYLIYERVWSRISWGRYV